MREQIGYSARMSNPSDGDSRSFSQRLKDDLLSGKYRPGEWLKQIDLENDYGVNRFEVRIALSELAARHLLDHAPNRGYRVAYPTGRAREELYEVRTVLETAAARMVAVRVTPPDLQAFEELVEKFDHDAKTGNYAGLVQLNGELHDKFYSMCGNTLLLTQIKELRERGLPGRSSGWQAPGGLQASNADHLEMLEMLKRRDAEGLAHVVYRHLNRWREFTKPSPE
jgi:DNA-binding GntR family transcriptional regulator